MNVDSFLFLNEDFYEIYGFKCRLYMYSVKHGTDSEVQNVTQERGSLYIFAIDLFSV